MKNKPLFEERDVEDLSRITLLKEVNSDKQIETLNKYLRKKDRIIDKTSKLLEEINETLYKKGD